MPIKLKPIAKRQKQAGVALILCLILAAVFAAISIYTSEKEKQQLQLFMGLQERVSQGYLAHSLMEKLHYSIVSNKKLVWQGSEVKLNGFSEPVTLTNPMYPDGQITLQIQDALGLISVTRPEANLLVKVISELAQEPKKGNEVMDAWFDWEDSDDLTRANGKERDTFSEPPYLPRNDKVQTISELGLIANMDEELFEKLEPFLIYTTYLDFAPKLASNRLRKLLGMVELSEEQRSNAYAKLKNGLFVEARQSFKIHLEIQGEYARFQREYVVTYRPDEIRLVSISEFGD